MHRSLKHVTSVKITMVTVKIRSWEFLCAFFFPSCSHGSLENLLSPRLSTQSYYLPQHPQSPPSKPLQAADTSVKPREMFPTAHRTLTQSSKWRLPFCSKSSNWMVQLATKSSYPMGASWKTAISIFLPLLTSVTNSSFQAGLLVFCLVEVCPILESSTLRAMYGSSRKVWGLGPTACLSDQGVGFRFTASQILIFRTPLKTTMVRWLHFFSLGFSTLWSEQGA